MEQSNGESERSRPARSIRTRAIPRSGIGVEALRGATTLEKQTLPVVIIASFAGLAIIQVILTW